jgi:hypothetical protein
MVLQVGGFSASRRPGAARSHRVKGAPSYPAEPDIIGIAPVRAPHQPLDRVLRVEFTGAAVKVMLDSHRYQLDGNGLIALLAQHARASNPIGRIWHKPP